MLWESFNSPFLLPVLLSPWSFALPWKSHEKNKTDTMLKFAHPHYLQSTRVGLKLRECEIHETCTCRRSSVIMRGGISFGAWINYGNYLQIYISFLCIFCNRDGHYRLCPWGASSTAYQIACVAMQALSLDCVRVAIAVAVTMADPFLVALVSMDVVLLVSIIFTIFIRYQVPPFHPRCRRSQTSRNSNYKIREILGSGGFGVVCKAVHWVSLI